MNYTDRACTVHTYAVNYDPMKDVPIVKAATGFTTSDGRNYILVFNEALWMPNLDHTLVNPNQMRSHGVEVQDNPYSIEPMAIKTWDDDFTTCLSSESATIFFNSWLPNVDDLASYPHVVLSSDHNWDPLKVKFPNSSDNDILEIESRNVATIKVSHESGDNGM